MYGYVVARSSIKYIDQPIVISGMNKASKLQCGFLPAAALNIRNVPEGHQVDTKCP